MTRRKINHLILLTIDNLAHFEDAFGKHFILFPELILSDVRHINGIVLHGGAALKLALTTRNRQWISRPM